MPRSGLLLLWVRPRRPSTSRPCSHSVWKGECVNDQNVVSCVPCHSEENGQQTLYFRIFPLLPSPNPKRSRRERSGKCGGHRMSESERMGRENPAALFIQTQAICKERSSSSSGVFLTSSWHSRPPPFRSGASNHFFADSNNECLSGVHAPSVRFRGIRLGPQHQGAGQDLSLPLQNRYAFPPLSF